MRLSFARAKLKRSPTTANALAASHVVLRARGGAIPLRDSPCVPLLVGSRRVSNRQYQPGGYLRGRPRRLRGGDAWAGGGSAGSDGGDCRLAACRPGVKVRCSSLCPTCAISQNSSNGTTLKR